MAFPGVKCGTLQIKVRAVHTTTRLDLLFGVLPCERKVLSFSAGLQNFSSPDGTQAPIKAHQTDLACIAVSQNGNICATASTKVIYNFSSSIFCLCIIDGATC